MNIKIYSGKLGKETLLTEIDTEFFNEIPHTGDLICLGDENDETIYTVKQTMFDYFRDEYNLFVKEYDWEA